MTKFTVITTFDKLKKGQLFSYCDVMTFKKKDSTTANPVDGQEHHVYGFEKNAPVKVEENPLTE